ncbi:MAG: dihydroneopterin triphosphate diphosphatase [Candidatus Muproteobacteria bacterium RBG_19FT_COMBO_61_10]|jgi:dATP pyrophosphohydrolase|uniref:Dihydroneopterin triphosphate diphosphatase n=1 Tax=Candidatus Muproteobacteria bacterium RBG_19FT_COMBO_61_10 TaxID=1817761 RepID=A0A1F6UP15_9PROT|nr:MAG: dihydroneopterin triphosphate diphosphatase [Candidatus Muproteobacteria bacterium RBG_19FT_COMBO_61_10]
MTGEQRYKRPESVLVVVYTRDGKVLLLRRADHPEFWQSITGSMEWDDASPVATAARELREETGIDVPTGRLRDWHITQRYELFPQWRHKYAPGVSENTEHFFSLELPAETAIRVSPGEHSEYRWVAFAEAVQQVFSWTNRDALQLLIQTRTAAPAPTGSV